MVTQIWLLCFQMCAVVNRYAVPHLCLRHHHGNFRMPRVVTITDGAKSVGDNITHQFTHPLAPSRTPVNSHRNVASPKPVVVLHLRLRYRKSGMPRDVTITDEPNLSAATSRIHFRRRRHDRRSTRIETRHRQSATRATGRIRRNESASFKYASIQCYRSNSRYQ